MVGGRFEYNRILLQTIIGSSSELQKESNNPQTSPRVNNCKYCTDTAAWCVGELLVIER